MTCSTFVKSPQIVEATRNATRDVISVTGAATLLLDWLQQDLGFRLSTLFVVIKV